MRDNLAVRLTPALNLLGADLDTFVRCADLLAMLARLRSELLFQVLHTHLTLHPSKILVGTLHIPLPCPHRLKRGGSFELFVPSLCHGGRSFRFRLTHRICRA